MNRFALVGLILVAAAGLGAQVPPSVESELLMLENDWYAAYQKQDAAFLDRLFADEYLATSEDGVTYTKVDELALVKDVSMTSFTRGDMKVRLYGETAVVTGLNTLRYSVKGVEYGGTLRFTDVFVRRDGRWQCVATQSTKVASQS